MRVDTERIRGSVAQILNQQELVINRGTEHGVLVGMEVRGIESAGPGNTRSRFRSSESVRSTWKRRWSKW